MAAGGLAEYPLSLDYLVSVHGACKWEAYETYTEASLNYLGTSVPKCFRGGAAKLGRDPTSCA